MTVKVSVPSHLLAVVLNKASVNLWSVHGEFCVSSDADADGRHSCDAQQAEIDELRRAAGFTGGLYRQDGEVQ